MADELQSHGEKRASDRRRTSEGLAWPPQMAAEDEINLYDLWATLVRRRWSIVIVFIVALLGAGAYAIAEEARHEVRAFVEIGEVPDASGEMQPLARPGSVVTRLRDILIPRIREANPDIGGGLPAIVAEVVDEPAGLIRLSAEVPVSHAERMRAFMQSVVEALRERHARIESMRLASVDRRIAELASQSKALESGRGNSGLLPRVAQRLGLDDDANAQGEDRQMLASLLLDAFSVSLVEQQREDRLGIEERLFALRLGRSESTPTAVPRPARISENAVGPGIGQILAIGAALGLIVGVLAALFQEFIANARAYRETTSDT